MSINEMESKARELRKALPDVAAAFTKESTVRRFYVA